MHVSRPTPAPSSGNADCGVQLHAWGSGESRQRAGGGEPAPGLAAAGGHGWQRAREEAHLEHFNFATEGPKEKWRRVACGLTCPSVTPRSRTRQCASVQEGAKKLLELLELRPCSRGDGRKEAGESTLWPPLQTSVVNVNKDACLPSAVGGV